MWRHTLVLLCAVVGAVWAEADVRESRVVNIAQGPVRGYKDSESGVYFFQSIPYASAPTGPNRYKAPLPPPKWTQPLEAVSKGIVCPQAKIPMPDIPENITMQEDCLIASVYVPDVRQKNLPVVVYVHGGAFQVGYGDWMLPTNIVADNNIIYVTFNYRLGTHGFLCLGTEDVPGNAGMKDQVAVLRWVKKNIASFGGNPDDITIQGSSAGSASVDLLMLSKSAEGLFNKAIPESGGGIAPWAIQSDPVQNAKEFAMSLNFTNVDNIYALEDFYKTASFESLTSVPFMENPDSTFGPSPCVERSTSEEVFLDKSPVDILKSGNYKKVPILYGFTNMEGLLRIDLFESWKKKLNEKFSEFLPQNLKFNNRNEKEKVVKQVKGYYFSTKGISIITITDYVDYFTDIIFAYPMLRTVKYHVEAGHDQVYLYEYSYEDYTTPYIPYTNIKGANHCAQSMAVFGLDLDKYSEKYEDMSILLRKIWGNFIKTGKPVPANSTLPEWPAVGKDWTPHMSLGNEITLRTTHECFYALARRTRFWDDIYDQYYRDPIPPPKPTSSKPPPRSDL